MCVGFFTTATICVLYLIMARLINNGKLTNAILSADSNDEIAYQINNRYIVTQI